MYKKSQDTQFMNNKKLDDKKNSISIMQKNLENMKIAAKQLMKKGEECDLPPLAKARHYLYNHYLKDKNPNNINKSEFEPNLLQNEEMYEDYTPQNKTIKQNKIIDSFSKSIKYKKRPFAQKERQVKYCVPTICEIGPHTNEQIPLLEELTQFKLNKSQIQQSQRFEKLFQATNSNRYSQEKKKRKANSFQKMGTNSIKQKQLIIDRIERSIQRSIPPINIDFQFDERHLLARKNSSNQQLLQNLQSQTLQPISYHRQYPKYPKKHLAANETLTHLAIDFQNPQQRMERNKKTQRQRQQKLSELNINSRSIPKTQDLQAEFLSSRYNFNRQRSFKQYFALMKDSIQQSIRRRKQIEKNQNKISQSLPQYAQEKQLIFPKSEQEQEKLTKTRRRQSNSTNTNNNPKKKQKNNYKAWSIQDYTPWDSKQIGGVEQQFNIHEDLNN